MLRPLIVKDGVRSCDVLAVKLNKFCNGINITSPASNVEEVRNLFIEYNNPDYILLDLPSKPGLDLVKKK